MATILEENVDDVNVDGVLYPYPEVEMVKANIFGTCLGINGSAPSENSGSAYRAKKRFSSELRLWNVCRLPIPRTAMVGYGTSCLSFTLLFADGERLQVQGRLEAGH